MATGRDASARSRAAAAVLLCVLLGGCATLPAEEAVAFRKMATANRDAFDRLTRQDAAAAAGYAAQQVGEGLGKLEQAGCDDDDPATSCTLRFDMAGWKIDFARPAPNTRKLIGGVARYGEAMAELAEAEDLDKLADKAAAAGEAVTALATAVFPGAGAVAGVVSAATVKLAKGRLAARRLDLLRRNAHAAAAIVAGASDRMTAIAVEAREHIKEASDQDLRTAMRDLGDAARVQGEIEAGYARLRPAAARGSQAAKTAIERIDDRRRALVLRRGAAAAALIGSTRAFSAAEALSTDFSGLKDAHAALVAKLDDPSVDLAEALADLKEWLGLLDDFAAAAG